LALLDHFHMNILETALNTHQLPFETISDHFWHFWTIST
jgi:hypothetical protein